MPSHYLIESFTSLVKHVFYITSQQTYYSLVQLNDNYNVVTYSSNLKVTITYFLKIVANVRRKEEAASSFILKDNILKLPLKKNKFIIIFSRLEFIINLKSS